MDDKKVIWVCPAGHPDYLMSLDSKSIGRGCSVCAKERQRRVCQYSRSGKLIKEYSSATEASKQTGVWRGGIERVCRKKFAEHEHIFEQSIAVLNSLDCGL